MRTRRWPVGMGMSGSGRIIPSVSPPSVESAFDAFVYFLLGVRAFGGDEHAAGSDKWQTQLEEGGQRGEAAGSRDVVDLPVIRVMPQILGAALKDMAIPEPQRSTTVLKELNLLAGGLDERDVQPRKRDGEGTPGKPPPEPTSMSLTPSVAGNAPAHHRLSRKRRDSTSSGSVMAVRLARRTVHDSNSSR